MAVHDSPTAVRLYPLDHPALQINAHAKITAEHGKQTADLGQGLAKSFDDYRYRAGVIEGLRIALILLEEAEKELQQRT